MTLECVNHLQCEVQFRLAGLVTFHSIAEALLFNFPVLFMMSSSSGSSAAANLGSSSAHLTDAVLQTQQLKPARTLDGAHFCNEHMSVVNLFASTRIESRRERLSADPRI